MVKKLDAIEIYEIAKSGNTGPKMQYSVSFPALCGKKSSSMCGKDWHRKVLKFFSMYFHRKKKLRGFGFVTAGNQVL